VRENKDIRLFFALWPGEALRERLHGAANSIPTQGSARRVAHDNLHLTLHFIGRAGSGPINFSSTSIARVLSTNPVLPGWVAQMRPPHSKNCMHSWDGSCACAVTSPRSDVTTRT